eukprot:1154767-Pelagomonas_calceolata.AAC.1
MHLNQLTVELSEEPVDCRERKQKAVNYQPAKFGPNWKNANLKAEEGLRWQGCLGSRQTLHQNSPTCSTPVRQLRR